MFRDARRFWRVSSKSPKIKGTDADVHPAALARALARAASDSAGEPNVAIGNLNIILYDDRLIKVKEGN